MSTPSQDDLYNVLQALKNGEGAKLTVSDILFGPQNFPVAGSIDDQRAKTIEHELITNGWVSAMKRGTESYILLTEKGKEELGENDSDESDSDDYPYSDPDNVRTKNQRIKHLWFLIDDYNLGSDNFIIDKTNDDSITVQLKETFNNFYINLQDNKNYFTIRRSPEPDDRPYLINDVKSWGEVIENYEKWLRDIEELIPKDEPAKVKISDMSSAESVILIEGPAGTLDFQNDRVKPAFNVGRKVDIFLKVINSINIKEESSVMIGIFGRWGRGKTFFWKQLKAKLESVKDVNYQCFEFQAWKYQDTPASWAYLYETFALRYHETERHWWTRFRNRIKLNFVRSGKMTFYYILLQIALWFGWYFLLSTQFKIGIFISFISSGLLSTLISAGLFYYKFSGLASELFVKYWKRASFNSFLGVQAEIQKELVLLLKAWIPDSQVGKRILFLFVDDIDRCDSQRMIQVIDSLKVMVDNPEISRRLVVIAAVDETILKRAIKLRYDPMVTSADKEKQLEKLGREYIDKLFLYGIKLGNISASDRLELFKNMTQTRTFFRNDHKQESKYWYGEAIAIDQDSAERKINIPDPDKSIQVLPNATLELMDYEIDILKKALVKFHTATPREIRIFYYRYLLAKEFKEFYVEKDSQVYNEWNTATNQAKKVILPYLLIHYSNYASHQDLLDEIDRVRNVKSVILNPPVTLFGEQFEFSSSLYLSLLRVVEIVVPY